MREIRFRAWDKKLKKWISITQMNFDDKGKLVYVYAAHNLYGKIDLPLSDLEIVRPSGLKDKNNKEIYEGDIVEIQQPAAYTHGVVSFMEGSFAFTSEEYPNGERVTVHLHSVKYQSNWKLEIIGNIYSNPELLKSNNLQEAA
jgi:uncharacterized phage protein (TIGR01671 family)